MRVLAIVLAGGAGQRLSPLTNRCAKPFLPFGGVYRLIDVTLSNCINSNLDDICVLTQKGASGLNRYLRRAIGVDLAVDRRAGRHVSDSGVVVVTALSPALKPEIEVRVRATA